MHQQKHNHCFRMDISAEGTVEEGLILYLHAKCSALIQPKLK